MAIFLFLCAVAGSFIGAAFFLAAKSALHEMQGLICFLISTVLFVGAAIVDAVNRLLPQETSPPPDRLFASPIELEEAEHILSMLVAAGYRLRVKRIHVWEIVAPQGGVHFIYSLGQLRELRRHVEFG